MEPGAALSSSAGPSPEFWGLPGRFGALRSAPGTSISATTSVGSSRRFAASTFRKSSTSRQKAFLGDCSTRAACFPSRATSTGARTASPVAGVRPRYASPRRAPNASGDVGPVRDSRRSTKPTSVASSSSRIFTNTSAVPRDCCPRREGRVGPGEEQATLEDPHFQAAFETWTTDQVDVRFILSTGMMSRLSALNRRFPGLRARFHHECLLLLLPSRRDRFEPSLYRRAGSQVQLAAFVDDVRACLSVVDDLNLNTRIWSKS